MAHRSLKPNAKEAILYYAKCSGAKNEWSEQDKLNAGARWFLEEALSIMLTVSDVGNNRTEYRDAEGLEDSHQTEEMIGRALAKYKSEMEQADDDE